MTLEEHEKWERWGWEAAQRDFERDIYKRCAEKDSRREVVRSLAEDGR